MITISGPQKVLFAKRLGDSWQMLATCLDIPDRESQRFATGAEGLDVLTWLEQHGRLEKLPEALEIIDRGDLAVIFQPPPDLEPTTPRWPGSPYPGLCAFSSEEALIFCGRDRHANELVERLKDPSHRFIAVVGASGSGKSSVVAAGVLPRLHQGAIPGSQDWIVLEFTPGGPGNDPFHALPVELEPLLRHQRLRARDIDQKKFVPSGGARRLVARPSTLRAPGFAPRPHPDGPRRWPGVSCVVFVPHLLLNRCTLFAASAAYERVALQKFSMSGPAQRAPQHLGAQSPCIRVPHVIDPTLHAGVKLGKADLVTAIGAPPLL